MPRPSPFEAPLHQAGDVNEGQPRGNHLCGFGDHGQAVEPQIGHGHFADIRLDGAERIICRLAAADCVNALNSVDLPTLGKPTIPHLKPMGVVSLNGYR